MTDYERIKREFDLSMIERLAQTVRQMPSMEDIWPVGSIYMSLDATDPAVRFGGVWERIQDTFLLAAGNAHPAGERGGEEAVVLKAAEMPHHKHYLLASQFSSVTDNAGHQIRTWAVSPDTDQPYALRTAPDAANYGLSSGTGGDQGHNNMPPYLSVYIWRRTK